MTMQQINTPTGPKFIAVPLGQTLVQGQVRKDLAIKLGHKIKVLSPRPDSSRALPYRALVQSSLVPMASLFSFSRRPEVRSSLQRRLKAPFRRQLSPPRRLVRLLRFKRAQPSASLRFDPYYHDDNCVELLRNDYTGDGNDDNSNKGDENKQLTKKMTTV